MTAYHDDLKHGQVLNRKVPASPLFSCCKSIGRLQSAMLLVEPWRDLREQDWEAKVPEPLANRAQKTDIRM